MIQHPFSHEVSSPNHLIITPNQRLANHLISDRLQNESRLDQPHCFAYPAFLNHLFKLLRTQKPHIDHPILLNDFQIRYLFQNILQTSSFTWDEGLLDEVLQTFTLCHAWQVKQEDPRFEYTPQHAQYRIWWIEFESKLRQLHAITPAHLPYYLANHIDACALPQHIRWLCFESYTPAQQYLQEALRHAGYCVSSDDLPQRQTQITHIQAHDLMEELNALIVWLKQAYREHKRIAIIVPNLERIHGTCARMLQTYFKPEDIHLSLGKPCIEYPIIHHAMLILSLTHHDISTQTLHTLLHSPYVHLISPILDRMEWIQSHRLRQEPILTWESVQRYQPALKNITPYPHEATIDEWISLFEQRLKQTGFPGPHALDSESYQCLERFQQLMETFRTISIYKTHLSHQEAYDALTTLTHMTQFQPKKDEAPIQVLGLFEASGSLFDAVWIMQMTETSFPLKGRPSALIPIVIQKEKHMPHISPLKEHHYACTLFHRLQQTCPHVYVSSVRFEQDTPCRPAFVIATLPIDLPHLEHTHTVQTIDVAESYHIPFHHHASIRGGSSLLANQAKCPFRAFAIHRLHVKKGITSSIGPTPLERGQLTHRILEKFWRHYRHHDIFMQYTSVELFDHLDQIIETCIEETISRQQSFPPLLKKIEHQRLKKLLEPYLRFEQSRPYFIVESLEEEHTITLSGITFHLKMDRLDQLDNDEKWVIDYKTRLPQEKPWHQTSPHEPQLLLYALLDPAIKGLLWIELRQGNLQYMGIAEQTTLPGIEQAHEAWITLRQQWHSQLSKLVEEFTSGFYVPQKSNFCSLCELKGLCRQY